MGITYNFFPLMIADTLAHVVVRGVVKANKCQTIMDVFLDVSFLCPSGDYWCYGDSII